MTQDFSGLEGKVVVITGGSRGIGKAVADFMIEHGAKVVIGDIIEDLGQSVVEEYNEKAGKKVAAFIKTDVSKYSDNQALFKLAETEFGGVDHALLNAGIGSGANSMFTEMDDEKEENIFNVNIIGVVKGTKVALLHMAKRGGGSIVHVSSASGFFSSPDLASYASSKHAVVGYTRSFALMPHICNVRVNAICPYWIDTEIIRNIHNPTKSLFDEYLEGCPRTPMNVVAEGVADLFLDSTKNTQTVIAAPDGLQTMGVPDFPKSFVKEGTIEAGHKYYTSLIDAGKTELEAAMKAYGF